MCWARPNKERVNSPFTCEFTFQEATSLPDVSLARLSRCIQLGRDPQADARCSKGRDDISHLSREHLVWASKLQLLQPGPGHQMCTSWKIEKAKLAHPLSDTKKQVKTFTSDNYFQLSDEKYLLLWVQPCSEPIVNSRKRNHRRTIEEENGKTDISRC